MKLSELNKRKVFARIYEALDKLTDDNHFFEGLVIPVKDIYVKTEFISMLSSSEQICNLCFIRVKHPNISNDRVYIIVPCLYCLDKFNSFPLHSMQFESFLYAPKLPIGNSLEEITHKVIDKIGDDIVLLDIDGDFNNEED